jgi:uracil-DNA glycosylase
LPPLTEFSHKDALRQLLEWQLAAGVDEALDEAPHDRIAEGIAERDMRMQRNAAPRPAPQVPPGTQSLRREAVHLPTEAAVRLARERAAAAHSLDALKDALTTFDGCALKATARQLVFADGNPQARVMMVGEGPGAEEDQQGLPFVGRAGQLLDRMLAAIGLDRTQVYIANIVPWRPPGNRTPTPQEVAACLPFIERQIALSSAEFLVCLGATPTIALLNQKDGITRLRGRWFDYKAGDRPVQALATLHPAFLLRQPLQKRFAWRDFLDLRERLSASR